MSALLLLSLLNEAAASTWTVRQDGTGDFSNLSVAVAASSDGDTLWVGPGTWSAALRLEGKVVNLIATDGAATTVLDGTGLDAQALRVANTGAATVSISGFTFRNSGARGLLAANATVVVEDCVFDGVGSASAMGGAISLLPGVTLTLSGSEFTGNVAASGAAIAANQSTLTISDTVFSGNNATYGGALYIAASTVSLSTVRFEGNVGSVHGGAAYFDNGSSVDVEGAVFTDNEADTGYGGAVLVGVNTQYADIDGQYAGNLAVAGHGGALFIYSGASLQLSGSTITANEAYAGGGIGAMNAAQVDIAGATLGSNYAIYGGAWYGSSVTRVDVRDSTFLANTTYYGGGALYVYTGEDWSFVDNVFQENVATYSAGGALAIGYAATLHMSGNQWSENRAYTYGGAWYVAGITTELTLTDERFEDNAAPYGGGGAAYLDLSPVVVASGLSFSGNQTEGSGGALLVDRSGLTVSGIELSRNIALKEAGGGMAFRWGADLSVQDATFTGNEAGDAGGGLSVRGAGLVTLLDVDAMGNSAEQAGGGLYLRDLSTLSATRLRLWENTADYGGGLYLRGAEGSHLDTLIVQDNEATYGGGLCLVESGLATVLQGGLLANRASRDGAAVYAWQAPFWLTNSLVAYNGGSAALVADDEATSGGSYGATFDNGADWGGALTAARFGDWQSADPSLGRFSTNGAADDDQLSLNADSPLRDAGDPALTDPDASRSDIGPMGGLLTWTEDADLDGVAAWLDCDDGEATSFPGAADTWYDGVDADCSGSDFDQDGDGVDAIEGGGEDCDDLDPERAADCSEPEVDTGEAADTAGPSAEAPVSGDSVGGKGGCDQSQSPVAGLSLLLAAAALLGRRPQSRAAVTGSTPVA